MSYKPIIIGIGGIKESGKDTVASMINYIYATGFAKAKFEDWITRRVSHDLTHKSRVIYFADDLKLCLSIIYDIPLEYFYSREYKDEKYYCIAEKRFVSESDIESSEFKKGYIIIGIDDLYEGQTLNHYIQHYEKGHLQDPSHITKKVCIKLRTLLQYFGTNLCRHQLGQDIWLNKTKSKAMSIAQAKRVCLIPDVRMANESAMIMNSAIQGVVIHIERPNLGVDNHLSETDVYSYNYHIINDSTLFKLFYKIMATINDINNSYGR